MPVVELFVSLELGKTKSEVRRLVDGGGAKLNGRKIDDPVTNYLNDVFTVPANPFSEVSCRSPWTVTRVPMGMPLPAMLAIGGWVVLR